MRTTLTLDEDVFQALRRRCSDRGAPLKVVVNEALRAGLVSLEGQPAERPPLELRTYRLGRSRLDSLDNIAEVLAYGEGEDLS